MPMPVSSMTAPRLRRRRPARGCTTSRARTSASALPARCIASCRGGQHGPGRSAAGVDRRVMLKELEDMPEGVIGFEASGKLAAEDYRDILLPVLERAAESGEVRFVIVITDFDGMTPGAVWEDLKVGVQHLRAWKRIALVTDISWMGHMTAMFGWMTPGEVKYF